MVKNPNSVKNSLNFSGKTIPTSAYAFSIGEMSTFLPGVQPADVRRCNVSSVMVI
jgi:hypothetical protein